jgi:hypothetical protein
MMEAIHFSSPSVLIRPTRRHIPEDGIRHKDKLDAFGIKTCEWKYMIAYGNELATFPLKKERDTFSTHFFQSFRIPGDGQSPETQ